MKPRVPLLVSTAIALSLTAPARAEPRLVYAPPSGFTVIVREGRATDAAGRTPALAELSRSPVEYIAAQLGPAGGVSATFQVSLKNRPFQFDAEHVERFATELGDELAHAGLPAQRKLVDLVEIAGRTAGRAVFVASGRRMLFYGVPDGPRTALLLYAASENDFPSLAKSFQASAQATRVEDRPSSPAPAPPTAGAKARVEQLPLGETLLRRLPPAPIASAIAAAVLAAIGVAVALGRARKSPPPAPRSTSARKPAPSRRARSRDRHGRRP